MKSSTFNLINAISLVLFGTLGYFAASVSSFTAFIPVVGGIILILLHNGVRSGKKIPAHIAVILTLIILVGMVKPLLGAIDRGDHMATVMIVVMIITGVLSFVAFITEFIKIRKTK